MHCRDARRRAIALGHKADREQGRARLLPRRRRAACRHRSHSARTAATRRSMSTARRRDPRRRRTPTRRTAGSRCSTATSHSTVHRENRRRRRIDPGLLGPGAAIFESQDAAVEGILGGKVKAGDVVVILYEGPRGGPGMQEMLYPTSYLKSKGLGKACALVTDGRFSGGTSGLSHRPRLAGGGGGRARSRSSRKATRSRSTSRTASSISR